jgi:heme-degrading monooxygenase HmoA
VGVRERAGRSYMGEVFERRGHHRLPKATVVADWMDDVGCLASSGGGAPMFARVAIYEIPGHRVEEAIGGFRAAIGQIKDMGGLEEIYVLVSPESDRAMTISLWDRQAAMEASRIKASRLRNDAAKVVDGSVQSVVEYEVAIQERIAS